MADDDDELEFIGGSFAEPARPQPAAAADGGRCCAQCGKKGKLRPCMGCKGTAADGTAVFYCGKDCQRGHWTKHKALCTWVKPQIKIVKAAATPPVSDAEEEEDAQAADDAAAEETLEAETGDADVASAASASGPSRGQKRPLEQPNDVLPEVALPAAPKGRIIRPAPLPDDVKKKAEAAFNLGADANVFRKAGTVTATLLRLKQLLGIELSEMARNQLRLAEQGLACAVLEELADRADVENPSEYVLDWLRRAKEEEVERAAGCKTLISPALFKKRFEQALKEDEAAIAARKAKGKGKGKGKDKGKGAKAREGPMPAAKTLLEVDGS
eukprot:TRINITY_DN12403_c0_g1_i1.p1 TRINITY_DN12403_c0_g1~~TRINITY_DN12403_c0_g1_i1.p1  ORF type:complete len:328 (+),score=116.98 TRINITY_DN12403_c0_g1_i1:42-1025(+)